MTIALARAHPGVAGHTRPAGIANASVHFAAASTTRAVERARALLARCTREAYITLACEIDALAMAKAIKWAQGKGTILAAVTLITEASGVDADTMVAALVRATSFLASFTIVAIIAHTSHVYALSSM